MLAHSVRETRVDGAGTCGGQDADSAAQAAQRTEWREWITEGDLTML